MKVLPREQKNKIKLNRKNGVEGNSKHQDLRTFNSDPGQRVSGATEVSVVTSLALLKYHIINQKNFIYCTLDIMLIPHLIPFPQPLWREVLAFPFY